MDSRVDDPLLAPVPCDSELPPPSAQHGINLLLPDAESIAGVVRSQFGLDHNEPCFLRFRNGHNEPLAHSTLVVNLRWPRRFFIQIASFPVRSSIATQILTQDQEPWPPMADQENEQLYSVRVLVHFLSCFRLLDVQQRQLEMMQTVIDNSAERVRQLEVSVLTGSTLQLQPRSTDPWRPPHDQPFIWDDQRESNDNMEQDAGLPEDAADDTS